LASRNDFMTSGNSLINQLLTEMDGFGGDDNILIIAATNRADSLDKALTRSGRFDLKINISLPYFHSRVKLLDYFL
jgi:cell division protease FtsH